MSSYWQSWPTPTPPEHASQIDWIGEDFDPDEFSHERANTVLAAQFKRK
jgi:hypothetical protein